MLDMRGYIRTCCLLSSCTLFPLQSSADTRIHACCSTPRPLRQGRLPPFHLLGRGFNLSSSRILAGGHQDHRGPGAILVWHDVGQHSHLRRGAGEGVSLTVQSARLLTGMPVISPGLPCCPLLLQLHRTRLSTLHLAATTQQMQSLHSLCKVCSKRLPGLRGMPTCAAFSCKVQPMEQDPRLICSPAELCRWSRAAGISLARGAGAQAWPCKPDHTHLFWQLPRHGSQHCARRRGDALC